jgi:polysaccharide pyruvyl transferase WcaK-like protein
MIHHVFANRMNIGDWLSARSIQSLLAPLPVTEHLCDAPFVAETLESLACLNHRDLIVIGGGGLFMDYFRPFWQGFSNLGARVPYAVWGVGVCDHKHRSSRIETDLLAPIVAGARLCVLRDELTRHHLPSARPPVACPSMNLVPTARSAGTGLLHVVNCGSVGDRVYQQMVMVLKTWARQADWPYREINNQVPAGDEVALAQLLASYREAAVIVSSGLHGCVIGLAIGRPVIAVSADRKIEAFMNSAGLADWVCDDSSLAALPGRLYKIGQQPSASGFVEQTRQANHQIANQVRALAERFR